MNQPKIKLRLHHLNLPKHILNATVGHDHPIWSRLLMGLLIMVLSKLIHESILIVDALKELVHAIGAVPWLEWLVEYSSINSNANAKSVTNDTKQNA